MGLCLSCMIASAKGCCAERGGGRHIWRAQSSNIPPLAHTTTQHNKEEFPLEKDEEEVRAFGASRAST